MGNTYTKAQAAATKKYLKNIGEYKLRVSKEDKEKYMDFAKSCGMSLKHVYHSGSRGKNRKRGDQK